MGEFPVIVAAGLAKQIAEALHEQIPSGRLEVAERLPTEEELACRFGVSRPTVREALKRLAAENLIHSRRGRRGGSAVRPPRPEEASSSPSNANKNTKPSALRYGRASRSDGGSDQGGDAEQ